MAITAQSKPPSPKTAPQPCTTSPSRPSYTFAVGDGDWLVHNTDIVCNLYRGRKGGSANRERLDATINTGYVMSDAVFDRYQSLINRMSSDEALKRAARYGELMHQRQIKRWGSIERYALLHADASSVINRPPLLQRTFQLVEKVIKKNYYHVNLSA
jgi:hypothetical protein